MSDLQNEFIRLKDLGVIFRKEPVKTEWGLEAIFEDSFGKLVQIIQQ